MANLSFPVADRKGPVIGLGVFFFATLGLFAFLGYFAFPIADDHGFAMSVARDGVLRIFFHMYTTVSGRFASNMLYGVAPVVVGNLGLFHALAFTQILLLVIAMRFLIAVCHDGGRSAAWFMTLCLSAAFIAVLPSPSQSLYWLSGSIVYFVSFNALFGVAAVLAFAGFSPERLQKYHAAILFVLLLLAMGGNEITASACEAFLFAAWVCSWYTRHPARRFFGGAFLAATVMLLFSFLAPGNFVRVEEIGPDLGRTWQWKFLLQSLGGAFEGYKWLLFTPVLPAIALCCLYLRPRWVPRDFGLSLPKRVTLVLIFACLLFFGEFLLVYITSKRAPYARITNAIYCSAFVFALAATAFLMRDVLRLRTWLAQRFTVSKMTAAVGALTVLLVLVQPTVRSAVYNLTTGEFAAFRAVWLERLALIPPKELAKDRVLTLPALRSRPFPLIFRDLEESQAKHQWIKSDFAAYYGLKDVIIEGTPKNSNF